VIRVIVVDDSAYMRQLLSRLVTVEGDIEVVDTAADPYEARDKIKQHNPDAITLDVEMPKMDGLSFLRNIMRLRPMPVVLVSSLVGAQVEVAVEALSIGAVDILAKPTQGEDEIGNFGRQLREKLRVAASLTPERLRCGAARPAAAPVAGAATSAAVHGRSFNRIIGIGASTGGTTAIKEVLRELPGDFPPIMISQHIPEQFSAAFAASTNRLTELQVVEAQDGQPVQRGFAYVAPGSHHLTLASEDGAYVCRLTQGERVNGHRPSVDVMFRSMVEVMGKRLVGVLLTGMGNDGARGLAQMRDAGAYTLAQDEATSVVWGMPGEAVKLDGACKVLPLHRIAPVLVGWAQRGQGAGARGVGASRAVGGEA
jgi:two-component system chemotaxis response regulator CheB